MEKERQEELLQKDAEQKTEEVTDTEKIEESEEEIETEQPISYKRVGQKKEQPPKRKLVGVENPKVETKRIIIFLIVTFGVCWFMEFSTIFPMYCSKDADMIAEAIEMIGSLMFAPAVGTLIARLFTGEGLLHSGFQFNFSKHKFCFLFGWFGTTALTFLGAVFYFVLFKSNFDPQMTNFVQSAVENGSTMDAANITAAFKTNLLMNVFIAPLLDIMNSFGVEWGFRGYLLPKLYRKFGTIPAMLISGLACGLWYAPLVVLGYFYGDGYYGYPVAGILAMCVFGMVTGCIYSFVCLRSGSIFPAVFASSAVNVMMSQAAYFTKDGGNFFIGPAPTGIVAGMPFIITAVIFIVYMYKHPVKPSSETQEQA